MTKRHNKARWPLLDAIVHEVKSVEVYRSVVNPSENTTISVKDKHV